MKRYWNILKTYKTNLIISPLLVTIYVLCETIQPWFMSKIIDEGVIPKDLSIITKFGIYMIGVSILGLIVSAINVYVSSTTAIGFGTKLRSLLFNKIQQLSFNEIDKFNTSSLITRLTNDIYRIQQVVLLIMRIMLRSPLMLIMSVFFVIKINTDLAMVLIAAIPILGISVYLILRKGFPLFMKVQQKLDNLNSIVRENLINIRVVKSFVREDFEAKRFEDKNEDLSQMIIRASNIVVTIFPAMQLIMNISIVAILWLGGAKVMTGQLQIGELISFVNYLMQVLMALMLLSMVIMNIARATASSERILEVIDTTSTLTNTAEGLSNRHKIIKGDITFDSVFFRYNGGENDVLKNINLNVKAGETAAIVGATGAAKSSLVQLIPRLYDPTLGNVLIDNINIKDYNLKELHHKIGMVLQKNELFTGSIIDNIRWGNTNATLEEIEEVAKAAQAHDFITSFTDGYDTLLGRGGINVSGGQKQRICIARALLRKPRILILDDSTSAVDSSTELKIRENINKLMQDITIIIITQRISTMQSADKVIVLDNGEVESIGKPEELLNTSEVFREIYYSQQSLL